jgi:hypothetical protein
LLLSARFIPLFSGFLPPRLLRFLFLLEIQLSI